MRSAFILFIIFKLSLFSFSQENVKLLPIKVDSKWGYIDYNGKIIVPPQYENEEPFFMGFGKVMKDGYIGIINSKGKEIIHPLYDEIIIIGNTQKNGIPDNYIFKCKRKNKWGCIDASGNTILNEEWNTIVLRDYILCSNESNNYYNPVFFTKNGIKVIDVKLKDIKKENIFNIYISPNDKEGVLDNEGNKIIKPNYENIAYVGNDLFLITKNSKVGIIDSKEDIKIKPCYDYISDFNNHLALVENNNKYGLINDKFNIILPAIYNKIAINSQNKVKAKLNHKLVYLDVDDSGNFADSTEYNNVKTILVSSYVGQDSTSSFQYSSGSNSFNKYNSNSNSLYIADRWFYSDSLKKWGLLSEEDDTLIMPTYDKVASCMFNDYSLVKIDNVKAKHPKDYEGPFYGIVRNSDGKILVPVSYWNIKYEDLKDTNDVIVRCANKDGTWGYLNKISNFKFTKVTFIDKCDNGFFRVLYGGELTHSSELTSNKNYVCDYYYYSNAIYGENRYYSYDREIHRYYYSKGGEWHYLIKDSICSPAYQFAENFIDKRAIVEIKNNWGVINERYDTVIPAIYSYIRFIAGDDKLLFKLFVNNQYLGLMDKEGKILTDMLYSDIGPFYNGFCYARKNNLFGYIDRKGKEISDFKFNKASNFSNDMAAVSVNNNWGYIDTTGKTVIEPQFKKADEFGEDLAFAKKQKETGFINKSGEFSFKLNCSNAYKFSNGVAWVNIKGKYGLIDNNGNTIRSPRYDNVFPYDKNKELYVVILSSKYGIADNKGDIVTPIQYDKIEKLAQSDMAIYFNNNKYGYLDKSGKIAIKADYEFVNNFYNDYAIVEKNKEYFIIDKTGKPVYNLQKYINDTILAKASADSTDNTSFSKFNGNEISSSLKKNQCFVIDNLNNEKYNIESAQIKNYKFFLVKENENYSINGFLKVKKYKYNKYYIKNATMKYYKLIIPIGENYAKYRLDTLYGIADINGNIIFKPTFEDIEYYKDDIYKIIYHNNLCYLRKNGTWIWKPVD